jgi:hypothetical protein
LGFWPQGRGVCPGGTGAGCACARFIGCDVNASRRLMVSSVALRIRLEARSMRKE